MYRNNKFLVLVTSVPSKFFTKNVEVFWVVEVYANFWDVYYNLIVKGVVKSSVWCNNCRTTAHSLGDTAISYHVYHCLQAAFL